MNLLRTACMTVGGLGLLPRGKGTFGTLPAAVAWWAARSFGAGDAWVLAGVAVASLLTVAWGKWAETRFGVKDPPQVVLDEIAGMWVTLLGMPLLPPAALAAAGFLLFRLFDILKPYPISRMQRLPSGLGIVADDLLAGVVANLCLRLGLRAAGIA